METKLDHNYPRANDTYCFNVQQVEKCIRRRASDPSSNLPSTTHLCVALLYPDEHTIQITIIMFVILPFRASSISKSYII